MTFRSIKRLFLCAFLLMHTTGFSQVKRNYHYVFWGRIVLTDKITDKLKWELWLQYRSQNANSQLNIFKEPQFSTVWTWLNYTISPKVKVAVTPFSYFNTWPLYASPTDLEASPVKELRWVIRGEHEHKLKYFQLMNRLGVEYRWRDFNNSDRYVSNYRIRYMLRLEKTVNTGLLSKPITFILNDEVLLQYGDAVKNNASVFDQNRVYLGFNYEVLKNIKFNLGYLYTLQERPSGKEWDHINTLWAIVTFDNVFSQFYSRQKKYNRLQQH